MSLPITTGPSAISWDVVIVTAIVCVVGSAFCSGCETGLMSVSRIRLHRYGQKHPRARVDTLRRFLDRLEDAILTCLIGTNLFLVLMSGVLTVALTARFGQRGELLTMLIVSVVIIIFGEILPKVLYREFPERLTVGSVPLVRGMMVLLWPFRVLLRAYSYLWTRLLPAGGAESEGMRESHPVANLLLAHTPAGDQDRQFRHSLERFLKLAHLDLRGIMRPLREVVTVSREASLEECLATAAESGFSRLPVRADEGRGLAGWLLVRDLLFLQESSPDTESIPPRLLRSPLLVDDGMTPYELFEELHAQGQQLAVAVDRHGEPLGMLTLEDLIETVVGSIQDEFDPPRPTERRTA